MKNLQRAGLLYFLAGSIVLMGVITAEAFYPVGYSTFSNEISDLGSTKPPNSLIYQPSSAIFNLTMLMAGLMASAATFFQHRYFEKWLFTIPVGLFSLGLVGVGIFPGNISPYHGMSSMLAFLSGGVCAITSFKITSPPFTHAGIVLGFLALTTWSLAVFSPEILLSYIGIGGIERWVAYPIMLFIIGLGGYLMNQLQVNTQKK